MDIFLCFREHFACMHGWQIFGTNYMTTLQAQFWLLLVFQSHCILMTNGMYYSEVASSNSSSSSFSSPSTCSSLPLWAYIIVATFLWAIVKNLLAIYNSLSNLIWLNCFFTVMHANGALAPAVLLALSEFCWLSPTLLAKQNSLSLWTSLIVETVLAVERCSTIYSRG